MSALWLIPAGLSVLSGFEQSKQARQNRKDMRRLARQQVLMAEQNEMLDKRELNEAMRRQKKEDERLAATARARAGASGFRYEGSVRQGVQQLALEQEEQMEWMAEAGASRIRMRKQEALLAAEQTRMGASQKDTYALQGILSGISFLGQSGLFSGGGGTGDYHHSSFYADL